MTTMTNPLASVRDAAAGLRPVTESVTSARTATRAEPPTADALEERLAAIRKVDSHVDAWVIGWFIGIAPDAVADAIAAYERIGVRS